MKNIFAFILALILVIVILGCTAEQKKPAAETVPEAVEIADTTKQVNSNQSETEFAEEREPTDDELREFGKIINIEDGPYPMFVVTVDFVERQFQEDFNLNIEAIDLDVNQLYDLQDKFAVIYYLSELENNIDDIFYEGKSIFTGSSQPVHPEEFVEGILEGAYEVSSGDLPDEVTVTDDYGNVTTFEYFITPEMVEVNDKKVTVTYWSRGVETITYLKGADD